jgi:hypothetical protein
VERGGDAVAAFVALHNAYFRHFVIQVKGVNRKNFAVQQSVAGRCPKFI